MTVILVLAASAVRAQKGAPCRNEIVEGEVKAGQTFERPIGGGLILALDPLPSGWILRVRPLSGPRGQHDYAELATPPYRSVSPLLISTDFSFRAQDAIAWNPRHFHLVTTRASFLQLQGWFDEYEHAATGSPARRAAEAQLVALAARTPEAELTIIDAHLVQGTANQTENAAMVALHLNLSAHELDQPADGKATPLGRLDWLRFRIRIALQNDFRPFAGSSIERGKCI